MSKISAVSLLLEAGFSSNQANWLMKNLAKEDINYLIFNEDSLEVEELYKRALIATGKYGFNESDINEMIIKKNEIYEHLWQLLYLAH